MKSNCARASLQADKYQSHDVALTQEKIFGAKSEMSKKKKHKLDLDQNLAGPNAHFTRRQMPLYFSGYLQFLRCSLCRASDNFEFTKV